MYLKGSTNYITKPNGCAEHFTGRLFTNTNHTSLFSVCHTGMEGSRGEEKRLPHSLRQQVPWEGGARVRREKGGPAIHSSAAPWDTSSLHPCCLQKASKDLLATFPLLQMSFSTGKGFLSPLIDFWAAGSFLIQRKAPAFSVSLGKAER